MAIGALLRGLAAAGRALRAAASTPAVRRAAVQAAQKAGQVFSRLKAGARQLCERATTRIQGLVRPPIAAQT
jgi:hypothetical protein